MFCYLRSKDLFKKDMMKNKCFCQVCVRTKKDEEGLYLLRHDSWTIPGI